MSPTLIGKAVVLAAQEAVEVHQLAALALPAHPAFFARVVDAVTMEQEERAHVLASVFFVEFANQGGAQVDQRTVFGRGLIGVGEIGD